MPKFTVEIDETWNGRMTKLQSLNITVSPATCSTDGKSVTLSVPGKSALYKVRDSINEMLESLEREPTLTKS